MLDVPHGLANKILDLKWVADMHDVQLVDLADWRDIHTDDFMALGNELEQWLTYLTKSDDNNPAFPFHNL